MTRTDLPSAVEVYTIYLTAETEWRFRIGHCGCITRGTKIQFHLDTSRTMFLSQVGVLFEEGIEVGENFFFVELP